MMKIFEKHGLPVRIAALVFSSLILSGCLSGGGGSGSGESSNLPPDPGATGRLTLEGIDSNGNGLRDDPEIFIASRVEDLTAANPQMDRSLARAALTQLARSILDDVALYSSMTSTSAGEAPTLVSLADDRKSEILRSGEQTVQCLLARGLDAEEEILRMRLVVLNTTARYTAYRAVDTALTGAFSEYSHPENLEDNCE